MWRAFDRPPETKVYSPTLAEFSDPMRYIESIKEEAEQYGVIKIIPPKVRPLSSLVPDTLDGCEIRDGKWIFLSKRKP